MQYIGALSTEERRGYQRDGFLVRESLFAPHEVDRLSQACEELCEQLAATSMEERKIDVSAYYVFEREAAQHVTVKWEPGSRGVIQGVEPVAHLHPVIAEFGNHPALTGPARDILGFDAVSLYTEKLNTKRAGVGGAYALHRDRPYWVGSSEDPDGMLTVLVALDEATAENGALEVLPGSHLIDDVPFRASELSFERNEIDPSRMDTSGMIAVELPAGGAIFFGSRLVHTSAPNHSDSDRRVMLFTYQRAGQRHTREYGRKWWSTNR